MRFGPYILLSVLVNLWPLSGLAATQVTFTKVADTDMSVPGGTDTFQGFPVILDIAPEISEGQVTFFDWGDSPLGIYLWDGQSITVVADKNTIAPSSSSQFSGPCCASIRGDRLLFTEIVDLVSGIYEYQNGTLTKLLDSTAIVPNGGGRLRTLAGSRAC